MTDRIVQWIVQRVVLTFLSWAGKYIPHYLAEWKRKKEREIAQSEALKEYNEIVADEGSTKEERAAAYAKLINSGRN